MRGVIRFILMAATMQVTVGVCPVARAQPSELPRPSAGSISRQLMLKYRLRKIADGTLTASLYHNRAEWQQLSPDQRDKYRRDVLAFRHKSPEEQTRLLALYEKLAKLSVEEQEAYTSRAKWLKVVAESLTPEERRELEQMTPEQRARRLLERRDHILREGRLLLPPEASPSTTGPATRAALSQE